METVENKEKDKILKKPETTIFQKTQLLKFNFWQLKAKYFAGGYILCVPIFALIYAQIPNDFYHTTVKYEQEYEELTEDFGNQIAYESLNLGNLSPIVFDSEYLATQEPLLYEYQNYIDTDCQFSLIKNFEIVGKQLKFDAIVYVEQHLKKDLNYQGDRYKAPFKKRFFTEIRMSIDFSEDREIRLSIPENIKAKATDLWQSNAKMVYFDVEELNEKNFFKAENLDIDFAKLIFNKDRIGGAKNPYFLYLTEDCYQKVISIYNVLKGFPTDLKGGFLRHLYLSATTITTLGLGDIYPITSRARALITLETLLGIIFTGLFLNAIARANNPS